MNPFGKYLLLAWLALGALVAATAQTEPAVRFEVTLYGTGLPGAGAPLSSLTDVKAGDSFDVKLRVLDQAGNPVPTYSKNVLLTIRAEFGQDTTVNVTGSDILAGGGETTLPITVTTSHAMTARTETDPNGWPYETGARISATDGSVITDNASGFFSVNPARFAVTYSGSSNPLVSTLFTAGRSYFARVTAYNADGTVASGYRGTVQVGFTHTQTTTDEYIINGVTLLDRGAGYDSDNPPLVTIVGDGDGATARASVIDLNGTNVIGAIGLGSAGSGYTVQPAITVEAPPDDGDPDTVESTAVAVIRGYEIVRPVANLGLDNATSLITDGGSGYDEFTPPAVTVVGGGGSGAIATATVSNSGAVTGITLDFSAATGYTSVPTLIIDPPADPAGTQATAEIVPVVAIEDTAGTASIVFGGIADLVPIIMPVAGNGYQLAADDGITFTADASEVFATRQTGNGSVLNVSDVTIRSGGDDAGESTSLTYTLKNDTDEPDINVSGPIDVHFVLYEGDRQRLQWTERVNASLFSAPDNESIERLGTSFTIPENLVAGSYTLEVWPGYNRNNAGTVGINLGNPPDLAITQFDYAPGQYRGGDAIRFDLTYHNQLNVGLTTALTTAFPHDGEYMIQIHLSTNSVYGDADDFLVWQESVRGTRAGTRLLPGQQMETSRYFKLPENMAGTYYVYARVNSAGGRDGTGLTPEFTSGVTIAGNNTIPPMESQKITILPKQASDTFRVSLTNAGSEAGGLSDNAAITRDGQYVVFESLASLAGATAADINNIFLRNLDGSSTTLISVASGAAAANGHSANPEISADGRYVVFQSSASNLVAGDSNGLQDIFVRDTQLDITRRLSVNPVTGKQANAGSQLPSVSADGRYVVFESSATNLSTVTAPSGVTQIYLYDRDADGDGIYDELDSGARTLTVVTQVSNTAGASSSTQPRISADGNYVAFITRCSTFLGLPTDSPYTQIVRWSRVSDQFKPVTTSLSSAGDLGDYNSAFPAINADGSYIAFASLAQNLESVPGFYFYNIPHVFRASMDASGVVGEIKRMNSRSGSILDEPDNPLSSSIFAPDLGSYEPSISDDGQLVAFASESQNLLAPVPVKSVDRTTFTSLYVYNSTDTNYSADVYLYNLDSTLPAPTVERASVSRFGYEATIYMEAAFSSNLNRPVSRRPVISGNGRYVAFSSSAEGRSGLIFGATNYINSDNNGVRDIYVYDRKAALPNYQNIPVASLMTPGLAEVTAGQQLTFVADAASAIRGIASVEFYANNSLIGTVTIPEPTSVNRFAFTWTAPSPGVGNTQTRPYQINVLAVDTAGVRSELSNEATVYVRQRIGTPAGVTIQSPAAPATTDAGATATVTVPQGNPIYLVAGVTVGSSPVNSVAFYTISGAEGTRMLGAGVALGGNRYGLVYGNSLPIGDHTLVAVVTDGAGNIVQSTGRLLRVTSAVTGTPPTVGSVFPGTGQTLTVGQALNLQAVVSDADGGIASVAVYANGVLVGTSVAAPYSISWTPTLAGTYSIVYVVTDTQGATTVTTPVSVVVTSAVGNVLPVVTFTSPVSTTTTTGGTTVVTPAAATDISSVVLLAQATQGSAAISKVEFFARSSFGGTLSLGTGTRFATGNVYRYVASPFSVGTYDLYAVVTDVAGNRVESNTSTLRVTAATASSPTISLSEPNPSTISLGQSTKLIATCVPSTGSNISKVDYFANGISIGSVAAAPYVLAYTAGSTGQYSIYAIVTDSAGNTAVSASQSLTVNALVGTAPTVTLTDTTAVKLATGSKLAFTAVVTTGNSPVSTLKFFASNINGGASTLLGSGTLVEGSTAYQLVYTNALAAGDYSVYAVVTDSNGNIVQSATRSLTSLAVTAPTVRIISPTAGTYNILDSTTFAAASARVTTRPATNPTFNGDQDITGVVIEDEGLNYAADVSAYIEVRNDPAFGGGVARTETLTVTLGANGIISGLAIANGGNARLFFYQSAVVVIEDNFNIPALTVVTSATASAGVETVRLYANGVLIGSRASAPYTFSWSPSRAGTYRLHAEVVDSDGITASSDPVTIIINPADDVAPVETLAAIENAYQAIFDRSPTNEETVSAVDRYGVTLSSGQVAALLLQSSDFRDDQGELILSHLAVWGEYPTASQYAALEAQREFNLTDVQIVDALLASVSYKERYGDIADLNSVNSSQYNRIRALALRTYRNLYGKDPSNSATANAVAKQFFYSIATLLETPGQAVVNFVNENFAGGKSGTTLTRLRIAGAILLIGNEQPTKTRIDAFVGLPLAAVADYYFDGGEPFSAGTVVSIETATGDEGAGTTYYASGLPKGLTIDRTTGVISGRLPSTAKAYAVTTWTQVNGVRSATSTRLLVVDPLQTKFVGTNDLILRDADGLPAGKLSVKVGGTASYTGTLAYRDGRSYSVKGVLSVVFDEEGNSSAYGEQSPIKRKSPLSALQLGLFFDNDGKLSASVTEGEDIDPIAEGEAIRVFTFTKSAPAPWSGSRAVNLTDISSETYFPEGAGSGSLKVSKTGVLTVSLKGADGAKITGSASGSIASEYRLYSRPYAKKPEGYFGGAIKFSDEATPALVEFPEDENDLTWMRPAGLSTYAEGFGPLKIQLDYVPIVF